MTAWVVKGGVLAPAGAAVKRSGVLAYSSPAAAPPAGDGDHHVQVSATYHDDYGLAYPLTYMFDLPVEVDSGATAEVRASTDEQWAQVPTRSRLGLFNGVEAARFDYASRTAAVSVHLRSHSDELWIRLRHAGETVGTFSHVAPYYDDRQAAATFTWDDWDGDPDYHAAQMAACTACADRLIVASPGLNPGGVAAHSHPPMGPTHWADLQGLVDTGLCDVVNHGHHHRGTGAPDMAVEVGAAQDAIKDNLILPPQSRRGANQWVYGWYDPFGNSSSTLRNALAPNGVIAQRATNNVAATVYTDWTAADIFDRHPISANADNDSIEVLNGAFDTAYAAGAIYMGFGHPWAFDWAPASSKVKSHLDYIARHPDVWYVGWGHLYAYRLAYLIVNGTFVP